jgi:hypothetical protein
MPTRSDSSRRGSRARSSWSTIWRRTIPVTTLCCS